MKFGLPVGSNEYRYSVLWCEFTVVARGTKFGKEDGIYTFMMTSLCTGFMIVVLVTCLSILVFQITYIVTLLPGDLLILHIYPC